MKIAVFGDIHGNLEALMKSYEAALKAGAEKIFHLGDLGGYAPFVNEVARFMIDNRIEGVQGNYDEAVADDKEHCGCKYLDPLQAEMSGKSFEWTKAHVSPEMKEYLKRLPFEIYLTVGGLKIVLFHASPGKNNLYWYEDRPGKFFMEMAGKTDADVLVFGHTHKPFRKDLFGRVFINAGSVGKPKDGDPRACVTLIGIEDRKVSSEFLRVTYDVKKTASAIIELGLPPYFAEKLREAV